MYCKRVLKTELNIWRYRFKSMGIARIIPLIICFVVIPLSFASMLKGVGIYQEDAYTRLFWIWEIINVITCVYWLMLLLETYINHRSKEFFRHLTGGWKIKDSIQMFLIYMLILSLTFLYIAFICKSFIPVAILWKDYLSLVCETIFVQGLFAFFCFRIKNTLFSMLGVGERIRRVEKAFATDLKTINQSFNEKSSGSIRVDYGEIERKCPNSMRSWKQNWDAISPILKFSQCSERSFIRLKPLKA